MTDKDDQGPAIEHGDHEGDGDGRVTRRTAIIGGAAAIGGVVIWTPESLAPVAQDAPRAAGHRAGHPDRALLAGLEEPACQDASRPAPGQVDDRQPSPRRGRRPPFRDRAMGARAAQVGFPAALCANLRAVRNVLVGSPAAPIILPPLDRLLATFGCPSGPTGGTGGA